MAGPGRALRDRRHDHSDSVYLLGPLEARVVAAAPAAFVRLVERGARGVAALTWPGAAEVRDAGERTRLALASVHRLDDAATDLDVVRAVAARAPGPLAASLLVAGDTIALTVQHGAADGNEAVALLAALLADAAGLPVPPEPPRARLPLASAALRAGPRPFLRYARHRRTAVAPEPMLLDLPAAGTATDVSRASFARVALSRDEVEAARGTGADRASASGAVTALSLAALRAVQRGPGDPRVLLPVDLRRLLPGRLVPGNFIATEGSGALGDAWDAHTATRALRQQVAIGLPQLLVGTARGLRAPRHDDGGGAELFVSVSAQRAPLPAAAGAVLGLASPGVWPSAVLVSAFLHEETTSVSFWDDSGRFALDEVAAATRAAVAAAAR